MSHHIAPNPSRDPATTTMQDRRVLVATGGPTMETEGTVASSDAVFAYLATKGAAHVQLADVSNPTKFIEALANTDVVFNAIHGRGGEDGGLHYLLELAAPDLPITGPAGWVHALGADKVAFKAFAASHRIPVPPAVTDTANDWPRYVVKPRFGGGSHGLVVLDRNDITTRSTPDHMVEALIDGRSITACVYPQLADQLPLLEIIPSAGGGIYTMADKRGRSEATYKIIHVNKTDWTHQVTNLSNILYSQLGDRGPIRFDWIIDKNNEPWLLEANTNPGWRPTGNMGRIVQAAGFSYADLIETVLSDATPVSRRTTFTATPVEQVRP